MQVLVDVPWTNAGDWLAELRRQRPALKLHVWPDLPDPGRIEVVVVWAPEARLFRGMDRLRAIIVPGAGVDQLWRHVERLPEVPIVRLVDPLMARRMAEYVLATVLDHHRQFGLYRTQQAAKVWMRHRHADPGDIGVGVMGLGVMGRAVARCLAMVGYDVAGWSRRPRRIEGVGCFAGATSLEAFLRRSDVLVCLLPLTAATRGILNARTFAALPDGALIVNAARGGHVVTADLIEALDSGKLAGAVLDAFEKEPLPPDSVLWRHAKVTITPHVASLSNPVSGVCQIVETLDRLARGMSPDHLVDPDAGY